MRNIFLIRLLSLLLCLGMTMELGICMPYEDLITVELDSETEQEENSEKEKEKTTTESPSDVGSSQSATLSKKRISKHDPYWNAPSIEFQTPPPEWSMN